MFAKKEVNQTNEVKVEMDYKGSVEDFKNGYGYMEMANINLGMAQSGLQHENEAEELLMETYVD